MKDETGIRVAVIGAGGYGGVGAIELLLRHPYTRIVRVVSLTEVGKPLSAIYPHLAGYCDLPITSLEDPAVCDNLDIALFSTPDGVGQKHAARFIEKGVKVIDYSGDFRFSSENHFAAYSTRIGKPADHDAPALLSRTVYGIPELHRNAIAQSKLVGNPGCFAIACILGLAPAVQRSLIDPESIICDCKSGVSGAGKKPAPGFHYPARYDSFNAYKVAGHQHVYEVERELSRLAGKEVTITFTPHVAPMTRGILATIYAGTRVTCVDSLVESYQDFYKNEKFVRILPPSAAPSTSDVRGSNYVNIWINLDTRTKKAIIVSHIDNLMKGQAGNAIQNLNIMMGLPETAGLDFPGQYP